jgi:N-acyl-D-aspartate/D-glutamate deacylase
MHDLVIRNAKIVDGTGRAAFGGDVAVDAGRVTGVGKVDEGGHQTIDAEGRVLAPGFIDVHTHYDVQGFWDTTLSPSPLHGVTTVFAGNCGFSVAPLDDTSGEYLMRTLARVEGMPIRSLETGVPWDWGTTEEFFDRVDRRLAVNTGFMIGHTAMRRFVMGADATKRYATEEEIVAMQALLRTGLQAGGIGFSSSWAPTHYDADGLPVPSRHAHPHELIELARVCSDFPGTSLEFLPNHPQDPLDGDLLELVIQMSVAARAPLNWNVMLVTAANLDHYKRRLEADDRARERGGRIVGLVITDMDQPRYSVWAGFGLDQVPGWLAATVGTLEERIRIFTDPAARAQLAAGANDPANPLPVIANWDAHTIAQTFTPETKQYEGRTLGEIAAKEGKAAFDAFCDIAVADNLRTYFVPFRPATTQADWEARAEIWTDPRAVLGGSDAGAHLDRISTYNYTTNLLKVGVRERRLLGLEQAVHLITQVPAQLYGVVDRGVLAEGGFADLVIFDEDTVGPLPTRIVDDLPGGAERLNSGAEGVGHVIVGGEEILRDGRFTEARPGRVLRSGVDLANSGLR